jgi:nicotinamide phosphoribosyltransferase
VKDYYGVAGVGASVWATEHSVATVWGPGKGEYEYLKAQLKRAHPDAIVSIVIDSYDADNFMKVVVADPEIRQMIIDRPGRTVFRPDSNDPLTNVCRYSEMLGNNFGYIINGKGYKVLNHNVGIIQGDGMNEKSIPEIYNEYIKTGWSAENFVTGSGGGLHTDGLTRDTDRWAVKVSHVEIDGASVNVQKTPKSDMTKASKAGKLILVRSQAGNQKPAFATYSSKTTNPTMFGSYIDELEVVYENGKLMRDQSFAEVRKIANSYL